MCKKYKSVSISTVVFLINASNAMAVPQLNVTYEAPGVTNSKLQGTIVYTFDDAGLHTGFNTMVPWITTAQNAWLNQESTTIGTFTSASIQPASRFGGAGGTGYFTDSATLVLDRPMSYFGLWWGSGSSSDYVDFYLSGELVASFKSTTYLIGLAPAFLGNPFQNVNRYNDPYGQFVWEPFAFINFIGQDGFTFDEVRTMYQWGFESDNWTLRDPSYGGTDRYPEEDPKVLPGKYVGTATTDNNIRTFDATILSTYVPEPSTYGLIGLGALVVAFAARRRKSKSA